MNIGELVTSHSQACLLDPLSISTTSIFYTTSTPADAWKTDLVPSRVNEMWIDPHEVGLFEGQRAQFCGAQHAKMLPRV